MSAVVVDNPESALPITSEDRDTTILDVQDGAGEREYAYERHTDPTVEEAKDIGALSSATQQDIVTENSQDAKMQDENFVDLKVNGTEADALSKDISLDVVPAFVLEKAGSSLFTNDADHKSASVEDSTYVPFDESLHGAVNDVVISSEDPKESAGQAAELSAVQDASGINIVKPGENLPVSSHDEGQVQHVKASDSIASDSTMPNQANITEEVPITATPDTEEQPTNGPTSDLQEDNTTPMLSETASDPEVRETAESQDADIFESATQFTATEEAEVISAEAPIDAAVSVELSVVSAAPAQEPFPQEVAVEEPTGLLPEVTTSEALSIADVLDAPELDASAINAVDVDAVEPTTVVEESNTVAVEEHASLPEEYPPSASLTAEDALSTGASSEDTNLLPVVVPDVMHSVADTHEESLGESFPDTIPDAAVDSVVQAEHPEAEAGPAMEPVDTAIVEPKDGEVVSISAPPNYEDTSAATVENGEIALEVDHSNSNHVVAAEAVAEVPADLTQTMENKESTLDVHATSEDLSTIAAEESAKVELVTSEPAVEADTADKDAIAADIKISETEPAQSALEEAEGMIVRETSTVIEERDASSDETLASTAQGSLLDFQGAESEPSSAQDEQVSFAPVASESVAAEYAPDNMDTAKQTTNDSKVSVNSSVLEQQEPSAEAASIDESSARDVSDIVASASETDAIAAEVVEAGDEPETSPTESVEEAVVETLSSAAATESLESTLVQASEPVVAPVQVTEDALVEAAETAAALVQADEDVSAAAPATAVASVESPEDTLVEASEPADAPVELTDTSVEVSEPVAAVVVEDVLVETSEPVAASLEVAEDAPSESAEDVPAETSEPVAAPVVEAEGVLAEVFEPAAPVVEAENTLVEVAAPVVEAEDILVEASEPVAAPGGEAEDALEASEPTVAPLEAVEAEAADAPVESTGDALIEVSEPAAAPVVGTEESEPSLEVAEDTPMAPLEEAEDTLAEVPEPVTALVVEAEDVLVEASEPVVVSLEAAEDASAEAPEAPAVASVESIEDTLVVVEASEPADAPVELTEDTSVEVSEPVAAVVVEDVLVETSEPVALSLEVAEDAPLEPAEDVPAETSEPAAAPMVEAEVVQIEAFEPTVAPPEVAGEVQVEVPEPASPEDPIEDTSLSVATPEVAEDEALETSVPVTDNVSDQPPENTVTTQELVVVGTEAGAAPLQEKDNVTESHLNPVSGEIDTGAAPIVQLTVLESTTEAIAEVPSTASEGLNAVPAAAIEVTEEDALDEPTPAVSAAETTELAVHADIERPKSPWTPSYTVTSQGPGIPTEQEIPEMEGLPPSETYIATPFDLESHIPVINVPTTVEEVPTGPAEQDTNAEAVSSRPSSPWVPSYSVSVQGSPSPSIPGSPVAAPANLPSDEEAVAIPVQPEIVVEDTQPPPDEVEPERTLVEDHELATQTSISKPEVESLEVEEALPEVQQVVAQDSERISDDVKIDATVPEQTVEIHEEHETNVYESSEAPVESAPAPDAPTSEDENVVEPDHATDDIQTLDVDNADISVERPKSPWGSYEVTTQQGPDASSEEQTITVSEQAKDDEYSAPRSFIQETAGDDIGTADSNVPVEERVSEQMDVAAMPKAETAETEVENALDSSRLTVDTTVNDIPERPKSPWTPSYSVTRQGSGVFEDPKDDAMLDTLEPLPPRAASPVSVVAPDEGKAEEDVLSTEAPATVEPVPQLPEETDIDQANGDVTPSADATKVFPSGHDRQGSQQSLTSLDTVDNSIAKDRKRLESTASSLFFPGGWFSRPAGRTSLDNARGEFTSSKPSSPVAATPAPTPAQPDTQAEDSANPGTEEKKSKWCTIM